jgi:hypothetical protein
MTIEKGGFLSTNINSAKSAVKRKIAIITSGGDAPGMNASVRSVVRIALVSRLKYLTLG